MKGSFGRASSAKLWPIGSQYSLLTFIIHHSLCRLVLFRRVHVIKNRRRESRARDFAPWNCFRANARKEPRDLVFAQCEAGAYGWERAPPIDRADRVHPMFSRFGDRHLGAGTPRTPAEVTQEFRLDKGQVATHKQIVFGLRFVQAGENSAQRPSIRQVVGPARQITQGRRRPRKTAFRRPAHDKNLLDHGAQQVDLSFQHGLAAEKEQRFRPTHPTARSACQHETGDRREAARHASILRRMVGGE